MAVNAISENSRSSTVSRFPLILSLMELTRLQIFREIAYLLSHLMSVTERLEPAWRRAFLRRTRLLDADFQGDVLAVISKSLCSMAYSTD